MLPNLFFYWTIDIQDGNMNLMLFLTEQYMVHSKTTLNKINTGIHFTYMKMNALKKLDNNLLKKPILIPTVVT